MTHCSVKVMWVLLLLHVAYLYYILLFPNHACPIHNAKRGTGITNTPKECITNQIADKPADLVREMPTSTNTTAKRLVGRIVNKLTHEYDQDINDRLQKLVEGRVSSDDTRLVALIKELLDPPSDHMVKTVRQILHTPQSQEAVKILQGRKKGFFVECGGLDGERSSNTLFLEQKMGWTGLLVEMDPYFYTQLRGKSRRAWSINACLSPFDYPTVMDYKESSGGAGQLLDDGARSGKTKTVTRKVPCFPFHSLMLALDQTRVDFFSLDVEGFEMEILRTVPFDKIDIRVLTVEYVHGRTGKEAYKTFMTNKGYSLHKDIHFHDYKAAMFVDDYIFVKKDNTS